MTQPATLPTRPAILELTEGRPSAPIALSAAERHALEDFFAATIKSGPDDTYPIQPGNIVGSLDVAGRTVVVQPKIPIDRVLFITAYAADPHNWQNHWSAIGHTGQLTDGVTALFLSAYERVTAQGLLRSYRTVDSATNAIRGRIRWPQQARQFRPLPIAVRYQLHDDDIPRTGSSAPLCRSCDNNGPVPQCCARG